ncbi:Endonuclease/exonuclease/phosphatase [Trema orientale]|uniref:Endonuclease/exonuclease/phosphatase n=1 Tax=Trema orientale TaxID=63057 RepID=A0A2P5AIP1_TREOI|nr:Endonuclease/exonuclease/phosphatase [Trema orientale]
MVRKKLDTRTKKVKEDGDNKAQNTCAYGEDDSRLIELLVQSSSNFGSGEEVANIMPPFPNENPSLKLSRSVQAASEWVLRSLVRKSNSDLIFLFETKVSLSMMDSVRQRLGFFKGSFIPSTGLAGGLCLFWHFGVQIEVLNATDSVIKARVIAEAGCFDWTLFYTYGSPYTSEKQTFWENISVRILNCNNPWVVIGDLNAVINQKEKVGADIFRGVQIISSIIF